MTERAENYTNLINGFICLMAWFGKERTLFGALKTILI